MDKAKKQQLKSRAHAMKPVIITGQAGITPALLAEIDRALEHHELLKIRINASNRQERGSMTQAVCSALGAETVQIIGHIATVFRQGPRRMA